MMRLGGSRRFPSNPSPTTRATNSSPLATTEDRWTLPGAAPRLLSGIGTAGRVKRSPKQS